MGHLVGFEQKTKSRAGWAGSSGELQLEPPGYMYRDDELNGENALGMAVWQYGSMAYR